MQDKLVAPVTGANTGIGLQDHALIGTAANIPTSPETPVVSISPVVLKVPERAVDLQIRVSAPTTGRNLPIILLSHGHGISNNLSSLNGYGPLANFWAAHGFIVIQPTHLSSKTLSLDPKTPGAPLFWRSRAEDMKSILDQLDIIEASVPEIKGRLDRSRIAVAGVSMGALTASMLLGAQVTDPTDPKNGTEVDMAEPRIKAGVLLSVPGKGGADLSAVAAHFSYFLDPQLCYYDDASPRGCGRQRFRWDDGPGCRLACRSVLPLPRPQVAAYAIWRKALAWRGFRVRRG